MVQICLEDPVLLHMSFLRMASYTTMILYICFWQFYVLIITLDIICNPDLFLKL
jgi:hypothetical protein